MRGGGRRRKKVSQTKAEKEEEKQDGSVFPFFFSPFSKHASYAVLHIVLTDGARKHEPERRDACLQGVEDTLSTILASE